MPQGDNQAPSPATTGLITVTGGGGNHLEGIMLNIGFLFTVDFLKRFNHSAPYLSK